MKKIKEKDASEVILEVPKAEKEKVAPARTEVKALLLPNKSLRLLYVMLNIPLHGSQSRARNRFAQQLKNRISEIEEVRISMLETHANKGEDGKAIIVPAKENQEEQYDISPEALKLYQKEFETFMEEDTIVDLVPSTKADLTQLRPLILESKVPLETVDGYVYEQLCVAFENI